MKPLVAPEPMRHPLLGVESFTSYLRRLASLYSVSLNQMLRYICESKEVSDLVGEEPFRLSVSTPTILSGYSHSVAKLTRRVEAASGNHTIGATTLQRISHSLTLNATGSIVTKRRYCKSCLAQLLMRGNTPLWEPLIWSLATVSCCPLHERPLDIADSQWRKFHPNDLKLSESQTKRNRADYLERWKIGETRKLIDYCSKEPASFTIENAPEIFISEFIRLQRMSPLEFSKKVGLGYTSVTLKISRTQKTSLSSVFFIAQRLAISPVDILDDPMVAAGQGSLFDISSANEINTPCLEAGRRPHALTKCHQLRDDLHLLLASPDPVPSLASVCHARGVSTGYARYRIPAVTIEYLTRYARDQNLRREQRRVEAHRVARMALLECLSHSGNASLKKVEQVTRSRTGLPKHVLAAALREELLLLKTEAKKVLLQ